MATEPFVGQLMMFAGNFAPYGWQQCNGQILPISQYTALFSLLGTTYGGNGTSNFALPNMQGSVPMGMGNGPGLTPRVEGEIGGSQTETILTSEMPAHTHVFNSGSAGGGHSGGANVGTPVGHTFGGLATGNNVYGTPGNGQPMLNTSVSVVGGSQPHNNLQPLLCVTFCIAMQGIFPTRG